MALETSILKCTKKTLGLDPTYTPFDLEITIHINSVFSRLTQLGVGPTAGFRIEDDSAKWEDFISDDRLSDVQSYMYLRVRMLFDPPDHGGVLASFKEQIEKLEWCINMTREDIDYPAAT